MSCSLITGLPGHGKSYYGVLQLLEELRRSKRYIVTNLPLDLKELCVFCEENFPDDPDVMGRVRLLNAEETGEFWLYDPEGCVIKGLKLWEPEEREWHKSVKPRAPLQVPDFSRRQEPTYPGTLYIIDEAHIYFDAYAWTTLGTDLSYFISQHRHLRSDVMFISQHPAKLAKRLRLDLEEYTVVTNLGKVKGWSGVTLPGWFMRETFAGKPDDPNPGEPERGRFRLKADTIGKLYSTSAGVGLAGRVDTQETKRGKHWSRWVLKVGVGAVLAIVLPFAALKAMGSLVNTGLGSYFGAAGAGMGVVKNITTNASAGMVPVQAAAALPPPAAPVRSDPVQERRAFYVEDVSVVGVAPGMLMLDDGRILSGRDHKWKQVGAGFAVVGPDVNGILKWKKKGDEFRARGGGGVYDDTPLSRRVVRNAL